MRHKPLVSLGPGAAWNSRLLRAERGFNIWKESFTPSLTSSVLFYHHRSAFTRLSTTIFTSVTFRNSLCVSWRLQSVPMCSLPSLFPRLATERQGASLPPARYFYTFIQITIFIYFYIYTDYYIYILLHLYRFLYLYTSTFIQITIFIYFYIYTDYYIYILLHLYRLLYLYTSTFIQITIFIYYCIYLQITIFIYYCIYIDYYIYILLHLYRLLYLYTTAFI